MARSYIMVTSSTADEHSYAAIDLLDEAIESHSEQLRIFKNGVELEEDTDFTVSSSDLEIILEDNLVAEDKLVIMRQTRMDKPYVKWKDTARFLAQDMNKNFDQLFFLCQEIQEEGEVVGHLDGVTPEEEDITDTFSVSTTEPVDDTVDYSAIELLPNDLIRHEDQLVVTVNGLLQELPRDYTIDPVAQEMVLGSTPDPAHVVKVTRATSPDRHFNPFSNASSISSSTTGLCFDQLTMLIEELPHWLGLDGHRIRNRKRPRRIRYIVYSGPGSVFTYRALPWTPDATILVYVNDTLLTNDEDYWIDFFNWEIEFPEPLDVDDHVTITLDTAVSLQLDDAFSNLNENADDVGATPGLAPACTIPTYRDANYEISTEEEDTDEDELVAESDSAIRCAWDLTEFMNKDLGLVSIGMTGYGYPTDILPWPDDLYVGNTMHFYFTDSTYNTTADDVTDAEITAIETDGWIIFPGLAAYVEAAMLQYGGQVYVVMTSDTSMSFHSLEKQQASNNHHAPRMSINSGTYPVRESADPLELIIDLGEPAQVKGNITTGNYVSGVENPDGGFACLGRNNIAASGTYRDWHFRHGFISSTVWDNIVNATIVDATLTFPCIAEPASALSVTLRGCTLSPFQPTSGHVITYYNTNCLPGEDITLTDWTVGDKEVDVTDMMQAFADTGGNAFSFIWQAPVPNTNDVFARVPSDLPSVNPILTIHYFAAP